MKWLIVALVLMSSPAFAGGKTIGWKFEMDLPAAEKRAGEYVERYASAFYLNDYEGRFRYDLELGIRAGQKWLPPEERGSGWDKYTNSEIYHFDKILPYYHCDVSYRLVHDKKYYPDIGIGFEWFNPLRVDGDRHDQFYFQKVRIFLEERF